jgi:oligopeptide transport system substrate-binding protein
MVKSYVKGKELDLVRNPYWERAWGKQLTLTQVNRPFVASEDTEYSDYHSSGDYDYTDVPAEDYTFAVGQSDFHQVPSLTTDYFGLNWHQPPFDNLQVRQAFDLALNKQLLVDRVFNGGAIPTNHIVPEGNPGYFPGLVGPDKTQSVTGNQAIAVQDLKQAQATCPAIADPSSLSPNLDYCPYIYTVAQKGQKLKPIELAAGTQSSATQEEIATIASQTWSQVLGLNVSVNPPLSDLNALVQFLFAGTNTAQIWQIGWLADYPDPEDWLSLQFYSNVPNNIQYVSNPQEDTLMNQADGNPNPTQRFSEYNLIEQFMVTNVAWIPYAQEKSSWRLRPWVQGFGLNEVLDMEDVDWPSVYILAH